MDPAAYDALVRRYIAAYNAFDIDGMLALTTDDVVFENYTGGERTAQASGRAALRALATAAAALFAEREQRLLSLELQGDRAVAEIAYRGVLRQDLPQGARAGEVLTLRGRSEFTARDGRLSRIIDRA